MKNTLIIILAFSVVASACTSNEAYPPADIASRESLVDEHIGCAPGEIRGNSTCDISPNPNSGIFGNLDVGLIEEQEIVYSGDSEGFLARPSAEGTYPGVVMIHEWWGLNDNIKDMARLLAQEGFVVLAVDLYKGEVAANSTRARELSSAARSDLDGSVSNMRAAVAYLRNLSYVDGERIGSIGWCFGGQQSLNLALSGEDMAGTVIYYGNLVNDTERLSAISWPVLGIFGSEDAGIPVQSVEAFKASLDELGVENEIVIYPGVGHAFANPSGAQYAPNETVDAWERTLEFFESSLKG